MDGPFRLFLFSTCLVWTCNFWATKCSLSLDHIYNNLNGFQSAYLEWYFFKQGQKELKYRTIQLKLSVNCSTIFLDNRLMCLSILKYTSIAGDIRACPTFSCYTETSCRYAFADVRGHTKGLSLQQLHGRPWPLDVRITECVASAY